MSTFDVKIEYVEGYLGPKARVVRGYIGVSGHSGRYISNDKLKIF